MEVEMFKKCTLLWLKHISNSRGRDRETQREGDRESQRRTEREREREKKASLCNPFITTTHLSHSSTSLKLPPPPCAVMLAPI